MASTRVIESVTTNRARIIVPVRHHHWRCIKSFSVTSMENGQPVHDYRSTDIYDENTKLQQMIFDIQYEDGDREKVFENPKAISISILGECEEDPVHHSEGLDPSFHSRMTLLEMEFHRRLNSRGMVDWTAASTVPAIIDHVGRFRVQKEKERLTAADAENCCFVER